MGKRFNNNAISVLVLLAFDTLFTPVLAADEPTEAWSYLSQDKWPAICLTGRRQSPMPINTFEALYDQSLTTLRPINFNFNINGTLSNIGNRGIRWTVDVPEEDPRLPKIVGGGLSGDYFIRHIDFRWSGSDCDGSDHYIDYKPTVLEVQLFTYRSTKGNTDSEITTDTIAIFSYMFQYGERNANWDPVFAAIDRVASPGPPYTLNITLSSVLPPITATQQFYRYNGSLPVPPCSENVVWTIFAARQSISRPQMASFRRVMAVGSINTVQVAYRNLQQPNARRIVTNVRSPTGGVASAANQGRSDGSRAGSESAAVETRADFILATIALLATVVLAN